MHNILMQCEQGRQKKGSNEIRELTNTTKILHFNEYKRRQKQKQTAISNWH